MVAPTGRRGRRTAFAGCDAGAPIDDAPALPPIRDVLARMREIPKRDRTRYLQSLIGPPTKNAMLLHQRALLVTALDEAELWPQGCRS